MCAFADDTPLLTVDLFAFGDKLFQLALCFEFDLKFCDIEIFSVVELSEQGGVDKLGDALCDAASVQLLGDVEKDDLGGKAGIDKVKQITDPLITDLLFEQGREILSKNLSVFQRVPEIFCE